MLVGFFAALLLLIVGLLLLPFIYICQLLSKTAEIRNRLLLPGFLLVAFLSDTGSCSQSLMFAIGYSFQEVQLFGQPFFDMFGRLWAVLNQGLDWFDLKKWFCLLRNNVTLLAQYRLPEYTLPLEAL